MNGGYDEGYRACSCFWGTEPGSFVRLLRTKLDFVGCKVLDAGCGEGKNAAYFAREGAVVDAIDVSELAIHNGRQHWGDLGGIHWIVSDVCQVELQVQHYDVVVAYGLLHCLQSPTVLLRLLTKLQNATRVSGCFVLCAFNARHQDLAAHPGFAPCLLPHSDYMNAFVGWEILAESDSDLTERHPHNNIEHTHALTRLIARKAQG